MTFTARVLVPSLLGDTRSRVFEVEADDFLHAVELAEGVREDNERLVGVALLFGPDPEGEPRNPAFTGVGHAVVKDAPNVPRRILGVDLDSPDPNVAPGCCGQCGPAGCGDVEPFDQDAP